MKKIERQISVNLSEFELRFLLSAGTGLLQNIPEGSLPTYTNFSKEEIMEFSKRIRKIMDQNDISL